MALVHLLAPAVRQAEHANFFAEMMRGTVEQATVAAPVPVTARKTGSVAE